MYNNNVNMEDVIMLSKRLICSNKENIIKYKWLLYTATQMRQQENKKR